MTGALKTVSDFFLDKAQPVFVFAVAYLMHNYYILLVLVFALIVILIIRANIVNIVWKIILEIIGILFLLTLLTVGYFFLAPMVFSSLKLPPAATKSTVAPATNPASSNGPNYYTVNCSSCWAESCPPDGYNYYGSDAASYNNYVDICKKCDCKSFRAESTPK
jgi:hypothetical protein